MYKKIWGTVMLSACFGMLLVTLFGPMAYIMAFAMVFFGFYLLFFS